MEGARRHLPARRPPTAGDVGFPLSVIRQSLGPSGQRKKLDERSCIEPPHSLEPLTRRSTRNPEHSRAIGRHDRPIRRSTAQLLVEPSLQWPLQRCPKPYHGTTLGMHVIATTGPLIDVGLQRMPCRCALHHRETSHDRPRLSHSLKPALCLGRRRGRHLFGCCRGQQNKERWERQVQGRVPRHVVARRPLHSSPLSSPSWASVREENLGSSARLPICSQPVLFLAPMNVVTARAVRVGRPLWLVSLKPRAAMQ